MPDMNGWPDRPVIYEINTAIWLTELSGAAGRPVTLADVPESAWDDVTPAGVNAVWLMGVWERSPAGLALANANPGLQASFAQALPGLRPRDVIGSPYCVRRYVVDAAFGGAPGLAAARARLAGRGVRLMLDYVPNHVAPDHPWTTSHPELFINGDEAAIGAEPANWLRSAGHILAHGRDPYFPPWPDVVQLNAFSPALREAATATLTHIAAQCDAIRCDMAMLMTNQIFAKTWGRWAGPEPDEEFWPAVIAGLQVGTDAGHILADDPVVEPLVVAEVESLLLQRPLEVPVGLGDEHGLRVCAAQFGDDGRPELLGRLRPGPAAPGLGEDLVDHQHGHVAADPVALRGDVRQGRRGRRTQGGRERVELHDIGPQREIRVAAVGQDVAAGPDPARRFGLDVGFVAVDEQVRVAGHPGMVGRDMVRHVIEEQPDAAGGEHGACLGQALRAAERRVDDIPAHAVR